MIKLLLQTILYGYLLPLSWSQGNPNQQPALQVRKHLFQCFDDKNRVIVENTDNIRTRDEHIFNIPPNQSSKSTWDFFGQTRNYPDKIEVYYFGSSHRDPMNPAEPLKVFTFWVGRQWKITEADIIPPKYSHYKIGDIVVCLPENSGLDKFQCIPGPVLGEIRIGENGKLETKTTQLAAQYDEGSQAHQIYLENNLFRNNPVFRGNDFTIWQKGIFHIQFEVPKSVCQVKIAISDETNAASVFKSGLKCPELECGVSPVQASNNRCGILSIPPSSCSEFYDQNIRWSQAGNNDFNAQGNHIQVEENGVYHFLVQYQGRYKNGNDGAGGCQQSGSTRVENVFDFDIEKSITPSCDPKSKTGEIKLTSNGTQSFEQTKYQVTQIFEGTHHSQSFGPIIVDHGGTGLLSSLSQGIYQVTASSGTCIRTKEFQLLPDAFTIFEPQVKAPRCHDSQDGAITISLDGPETDYLGSDIEISLQNLDSQQVKTEILGDRLQMQYSGLNPGNYQFKVYDKNTKCFSQRAFQIDRPTPVMANIDISNPFNNGQCEGERPGKAGKITVTPGGGTVNNNLFNLGYQVEIFRGAMGLVPQINGTEFTFDSLPAGDYEIGVTDSNNCTTYYPVPLFDETIEVEAYLESNQCKAAVTTHIYRVDQEGERRLVDSRKKQNVRFEENSEVSVNFEGCYFNTELIYGANLDPGIYGVYVPNALYTGSDFAHPDNRILRPFVPKGREDEKVYNFQVYDRWGGLVYSSDGLTVAQLESQGWRGLDLSQCRFLNSGVYVYQMEIGQCRLKVRGDVTIKR